MILLLSIKEKKLYNFVTCDLHKESALNTGTCRIQFTIKIYEKTELNLVVSKMEIWQSHFYFEKQAKAFGTRILGDKFVQNFAMGSGDKVNVPKIAWSPHKTLTFLVFVSEKLDGKWGSLACMVILM